MKRFLAIAVILAVPMVAGAEEGLSPIQQYLYEESGYVPAQVATPVASPNAPYDTAYVPVTEPEPTVAPIDGTDVPPRQHLNDGVRGMNF